MVIIKGCGALGFSYNSCPFPFWRRVGGRPSIHISLWFIKIILYLPFKDVTPKGHGTAFSSYGFFWWPRLNKRISFFWEHLKDKNEIKVKF